jgi:hypothetical protein
MLENILEVLSVAKGETENIRIAQGKYALPQTFKGAYKQIKKEIKWHKSTQ